MSKEQIKNLVEFRNNFPVSTSVGDIQRIFGVKPDTKLVKELDLKVRSIHNDTIQKKLDLAFKHRDLFFIFDWVRYIGITGSTAAGNANEEDDIDLLIVVKNHRMWIYRGLMLLKSLKRITRADKSSRTNKFCVNMIVEERGLQFNNDIFNFHEIYFMKDLFNYGYRDYIINRNRWVEQFGGKLPSNITGYRPVKCVPLSLRLLNVCAFVAQYIYMILLGHNPSFGRILKNNKIGRIEFFPEDFKKEKLFNFKEY